MAEGRGGRVAGNARTSSRESSSGYFSLRLPSFRDVLMLYPTPPVPLPSEPGLLRLIWDGRRLVRPVFIDDEQAAVFTDWLEILRAAGVPFAVGGAYAVYAFTGAWRDTKDLDLFLTPRDLKAALDALRAAGYETEVRDRYWLAKAHRPPYLLDLLFAVRHSTSLKVGDHWFATCRPAELLGVQTCLLSPEELIATKVYLGARDRFDGADIVHLIRATHGRIDWEHLIDLLRGDDEIVLWHLLLFQYVYPGHRDELPLDLMQRIFDKMMAAGRSPADTRRFRGMLIDPVSFAVDMAQWGYEDTREHEPLVAHDGAAMVVDDEEAA